MRHPLAFTALTASALLFAACASPPQSEPQPTAGAGHGQVAGAAEVSEPPLHLLTATTDGRLTLLDLLSEETSSLGRIDAPLATATDGRYLFADTGDGVEIVDSGMWTWDHVDHFHYYRAEPRVLEKVPGHGTARIATTNSSTTGDTGIFFADGEAVLLDTEALSKGEVAERFRVRMPEHEGYIVPVGDHALVTTGAGAVQVRDRDGALHGDPVPCADPAGTLTTRVGAILGCRDSVLLAVAADAGTVVERIALPDGVTAPRVWANREGRPTAAGLSPDGSIVLLDTRARTAATIAAPRPLLAVTAVDDASEHVLGLTADGRVSVIDGATGAELALTEPLVAASLAAGWTPTLIADDRRAYLNGITERVLFEIDFADAGRIARTFTTTDEPAFVAETGR
ncbi:ABC transporter [Microbacterium sp. Clip185]|uniref:ABC transporter n=1 Tax=Microbacterium sp. Clip185 TaxID=3025663 RepID=UPI002365A732|nr:ABC transporter [Microbacterium sp. Clip185]WDG17965.1 ABC transporter [Microbacterium sp. Clip185]